MWIEGREHRAILSNALMPPRLDSVRMQQLLVVLFTLLTLLGLCVLMPLYIWSDTGRVSGFDATTASFTDPSATVLWSTVSRTSLLTLHQARILTLVARLCALGVCVGNLLSHHCHCHDCCVILSCTIHSTPSRFQGANRASSSVTFSP